VSIFKANVRGGLQPFKRLRKRFNLKCRGNGKTLKQYALHFILDISVAETPFDVNSNFYIFYPCNIL